ncbi:FKBP-type peptidyl-prolyl cis-trans isomerase [Flavobacterium hungaricum]|uniref:Peptidyl-prolyl cis-trans isomerase n=1 Tax=Flavobacterium hungaricum TaxID=2082725 RepID=A0ABR9TNZ5_9FLAO|nr:FKBP-type peptidyl-prolyl cis-trans isomerase [Flavobacterium hungaricum]MBE8727060.1 peptidylprolyl isomerase [Flavobacterium hungaricum]
MKKLLAVLFILTLFTSCSIDGGKNPENITPKDYSAENETQITEYLAKNNLTAKAQATGTGLYFIINEQGTGKQASASSTVTVVYKGTLLSGSVFDQSNADGATFPLSQLIEGWKEGIPYFKEGGSGVLIIPAHLGYGSYNQKGIPAGSVLIFDIKLVAVTN